MISTSLPQLCVSPLCLMADHWSCKERQRAKQEGGAQEMMGSTGS
jgi:hypothetical protein